MILLGQTENKCLGFSCRCVIMLDVFRELREETTLQARLPLLAGRKFRNETSLAKKVNGRMHLISDMKNVMFKTNFISISNSCMSICVVGKVN